MNDRSAPKGAPEVSPPRSTQSNSTGTSSGYNKSQRAAARFQVNYERRWNEPVEHASAEQVRKLQADVSRLLRLYTGEQAP